MGRRGGIPVGEIVAKITAWPAEKRRHYLILAMKTEKARHRREQLRKVLCRTTTEVIRTEIGQNVGH